jgi:hypothetical protein
VDDRGVLATRAINIEGDIDIEWSTGSVVSFTASRTVVSQTLATTAANQEFFMFIATNGNLFVRVGGVERSTSPSIVYAPNTKYRWRLQGTTVNLWINDVLQPVMSLTRGTTRESSAQTVIGSAANTFFYSGILYDIRINGVLWEMGNRNEAIQPSTPAGNSMTLVNTTSDRWEQVPCRV